MIDSEFAPVFILKCLYEIDSPTRISSLNEWFQKINFDVAPKDLLNSIHQLEADGYLEVLSKLTNELDNVVIITNSGQESFRHFDKIFRK